MPAVIVKRYVGGYRGLENYSIRQHVNGSFQIYHDDPWRGLEHLYGDDPRPVSGLYADIATAEAELLRLPEFQDDSSPT
jgi:hypothetical protein